MEDQNFWYHTFQESLYYYIYIPVDYYISPRGIFRLSSAIAMGYRNYYKFYLHRRADDRVARGLLRFSLAVIPVNIIYDVFEDRAAPGDSKIPKIKTDEINGSPVFKIEFSGLSKNSVLHNISKPLRSRGVKSITFTSSIIDDEIHILGDLTQTGKKNKIFFDISFPKLNSDSYYWLELCCNKYINCNTSSSTPLSVLSEEVVDELVFFLDGNYDPLVSKSNFNRAKGIDFSVNEDFVVAKIQQREYDIVSYSICNTQTDTLQIKSNQLHFSNQTLVLELKQKLSFQPEGWLAYTINLAFKQFEHIFLIALIDEFFEGFFLGECAICHKNMIAGKISMAGCHRHYFCTLCLRQWALLGSGRCPYCNR
ncbi:RING finger protein [Endozoicomonas sp. 8E]|uniref:RING finger protein n=1 Tax=Endozoicomonas sp. 8E TaxID=3035692 RepID=UPI0029392EF6|nr:RING finger protein [Endozoicomonas sp. 8E]WOG25959.1 RING finger protein [Endozoicomonas sp. 8E]